MQHKRSFSAKSAKTVGNGSGDFAEKRKRFSFGLLKIRKKQQHETQKGGQRRNH